jgi:hypothetical protein
MSVTGFDQKAILFDPQLANSYSYARDNPITSKDPKGNFIALLWPAIELGAEAWGAYSTGSSIGEILNTHVLFRGDYTDDQRSDAEFWFGVGLVTGGEGRIAKNLAPYEKVVLNVGPDVARMIGNQFGGASSQNFHPQQFNNWAYQSSSQVNLSVYGQSIGYSVVTQQPSYTGGSNPNYSAQTYRVPSGAVVDWAGNVIVPATQQPPPPPPPPPPSKK